MCVCVSVKGGEGEGRRLKSTHGKVFVRSEGEKTRKEKMFLLGKWRELGKEGCVRRSFFFILLFFSGLGSARPSPENLFFRNRMHHHPPPVYEALLLQQMLFKRRKEGGKEGARNIGISMQKGKEKRKKPFGNREWEESPFTIFAEGREAISAAISIAKKE